MEKKKKKRSVNIGDFKPSPESSVSQVDTTESKFILLLTKDQDPFLWFNRIGRRKF